MNPEKTPVGGKKDGRNAFKRRVLLFMPTRFHCIDMESDKEFLFLTDNWPLPPLPFDDAIEAAGSPPPHQQQQQQLQASPSPMIKTEEGCNDYDDDDATVFAADEDDDADEKDRAAAAAALSKSEIRRRKNRAAARRSRERAKARMATLEEESRELARLKPRIEIFKRNNRFLCRVIEQLVITEPKLLQFLLTEYGTGVPKPILE